MEASIVLLSVLVLIMAIYLIYTILEAEKI